MVSESYKLAVLQFIREHADGVPMCDIRAKFPKAPLREMENEGLICYKNERWHVVQVEVGHTSDFILVLTPRIRPSRRSSKS